MSAQKSSPAPLHLDFSLLPPRADRFCRLLPLLGEAGFDTILIDWESSFPWTVDTRMLGCGVFTEEALSGILTVASRCGVTLRPRLARCGLIHALDRVPGFSHISGVATDPRALESYASAAIRMVERLIDDICSISDTPDALVLGCSPGADSTYRRRFVEPVEKLVREHGIEPILERTGDPRTPEFSPAESTISAWLHREPHRPGLAALSAVVEPVAATVQRLEVFVQGAWTGIREAMEVVVLASRDPGERVRLGGASPQVQSLRRTVAECQRLRDEVEPLLQQILEPAVAADYLNRRLSPIEELAAVSLARCRSLG